jgi:hypothetical protein
LKECVELGKEFVVVEQLLEREIGRLQEGHLEEMLL